VRSISCNGSTADEPVEQCVGGPVLAVSEIKPRHPSLDMPLVLTKGPGRIIDNVEMEVGILDNFPRSQFLSEVLLVTGLHVGIDGIALVERNAETCRCWSAPENGAGVLLQPAEQAGVDVELEMPGPRPEPSTEPIEIRGMTGGAQFLPVIEDLPRRRLRHGPARLAPPVAVSGPYGGGRNSPLVPDALSWELSVEHHGLSPAPGDAQTQRRFRECEPISWHGLYYTNTGTISTQPSSDPVLRLIKEERERKGMAVRGGATSMAAANAFVTDLEADRRRPSPLR